MVKAQIIKTDGSKEDIEFIKKDSLSVMQTAVGGLIEVVGLPAHEKGKLMLVNEEGVIEGLPHNRLASIMAGQPISGDAVVMNIKDFD